MFFPEMPQLSAMSEKIFDPIWTIKNHSNSKCELIHVRKGSVSHMSEAGKFKAESNDCLITPSNTMHKDVFDQAVGLEVFMIFFTWPFEGEYLKHVNNSNINQISAETKSSISVVFEEMRTDSGGEDIDMFIASSRLLTILMLLYRDIVCSQKREASDRNIKKPQWLVAEAKKYLEENYQKAVKLEDIAESLKISPFYLSRIFSRESNFSVFEYLNSVRMRKARELLREGRHIIADVAYMTGFEDSSYFSKVYKRYYGHSPSESRF